MDTQKLRHQDLTLSLLFKSAWLNFLNEYQITFEPETTNYIQQKIILLLSQRFEQVFTVYDSWTALAVIKEKDKFWPLFTEYLRFMEHLKTCFRPTHCKAYFMFKVSKKFEFANEFFPAASPELTHYIRTHQVNLSLFPWIRRKRFIVNKK